MLMLMMSNSENLTSIQKGEKQSIIEANVKWYSNIDIFSDIDIDIDSIDIIQAIDIHIVDDISSSLKFIWHSGNWYWYWWSLIVIHWPFSIVFIDDIRWWNWPDQSRHLCLWTDLDLGFDIHWWPLLMLFVDCRHSLLNRWRWYSWQWPYSAIHCW